MSETKASPPIPEPPQEASGVSVKHPYKDVKADDKEKGMIAGMTQKQRIESGLGWLKAHDEVDYKGYVVEKLIPSPLLAASKQSGHGDHGAHTEQKPRHGGGMSDHHNTGAASSSAQGSEPVHKAQEEPVLTEVSLRDRLLEAEGLSKEVGSKEAWVALLSSIVQKIGESRNTNTPIQLEKEELLLIEIYLATAQNKLLDNSELKVLVGLLSTQSPNSPRPPYIPGVLPELNEAWLRYDSFDQIAKELRKKHREKEIDFDSQEVQSLDEVMGNALDLFPNSASAQTT